MRRDTVFQKPGLPGDFAFDKAVADVFDDMLARSIPFYSEQQAMVRSLARTFWPQGSTVYDLGCSKGTALIDLARDLPECRRLVGYDSSEPMLEGARRNVSAAGLDGRIEVTFADLTAAPESLDFQGAGLVTACWTLQFLRPDARIKLVRRIHDCLRPEGALIVCEKVRLADPGLNHQFVDYYYDFKHRAGYSDNEIRRKEEALEGVLLPQTTDYNLTLLKAAGFRTVELYFRWFNFAAFLCLK